MSEHDVLKKNRNFYIGVGGTVLEGLLSGSFAVPAILITIIIITKGKPQ